MGMEILNSTEDDEIALRSFPSVLLVGPPNVGKRSILQRLLGMGQAKSLTCSSFGVTCHGWTIDTKYYTADVCISVVQLGDSESDKSSRMYALSEKCQALVLVFDLSNPVTFELLQEWVSNVELQSLDILLCVGNKADRVPDHFGHREYRRRLQKRGESSSDPHPEFWDFGIQRSDGSSLLSGDDGNTLEGRRQLCLDWCTERGIEYIETCALDCAFDQCISVDGDIQGVNRIWGALSCHMWPGMIMKSDTQLFDPSDQPELQDDSTDEDSEVSIDYELLSNGSAEPWDGDVGPWSIYENACVSNTVAVQEQERGVADNITEREAQNSVISLHQGTEESSHPDIASDGICEPPLETLTCDDTNLDESISSVQDNATAALVAPINGEQVNRTLSEDDASDYSGDENGTMHKEQSLDQLMLEMARMRENARLMPDSQRRERAARLALQMASMFDEDD